MALRRERGRGGYAMLGWLGRLRRRQAAAAGERHRPRLRLSPGDAAAARAAPAGRGARPCGCARPGELPGPPASLQGQKRPHMHTRCHPAAARLAAGPGLAAWRAARNDARPGAPGAPRSARAAVFCSRLRVGSTPAATATVAALIEHSPLTRLRAARQTKVLPRSCCPAAPRSDRAPWIGPARHGRVSSSARRPKSGKSSCTPRRSYRLPATLSFVLVASG